MENKIIRHKIHKYIMRFCDSHIVSEKSIYYTFGTQTLRVSDHIGKNSSGDLSIIIDKKNNYVLHSHKNNNIIVINYDDIKTLIKGLTINSLLCCINSTNTAKDYWKNINGEYTASLCQRIHELKEENAKLKILTNNK